jgi:hypothetical protein
MLSEVFIMDTIQYNTKLKASGDEYRKIVFWNRFLRNPTETILTLLPAVLAIILMCSGFLNGFLGIIYAACFAYPIYIFAVQFRSSVNYHLKHRDPSEDAPCTITLMDSGILAEIPSHEITTTYLWDAFTTIYCKFGYFMCFEGSKMTVMLRVADMSEEQQSVVPDFIKSHVNQNICKITF